MIDRIFHNFNKWEDFNWGMYETVCFMDSRSMIEDCKSLLSCEGWLYEAMTFVSHTWQYSSEQNLTNIHRNRQAWLGQAACCWVHGAPEYITKAAWNELSCDQQKKANEIADDIIIDWEKKHSTRYFEWQN